MLFTVFVLFIAFAILILICIAIGVLTECNYDREVPKVKFSTFRDWYAMNPKSWVKGCEINVVYKRVGHNYWGNKGKVRVSCLEALRMWRFWRKVEKDKLKSYSNKNLEDILLSVQEDIENYKRKYVNFS